MEIGEEEKTNFFGDCKMKESKVEIKTCRRWFAKKKKKEDDIKPVIEKI